MTNGRIFAYGLLGLPLAFAALPIYVHVPKFYAEAAGMELALLGAILLGARLLDAGIDPWLGWLADRVRRPQMVAIALLPFAAGFVALLNPPAQNAGLWLLGSLALTLHPASLLPRWLTRRGGADIGENSSLRTRLTAAREGFGLLGVVLAAALPALIASNMVDGVARLAWILPPLLLVAALVTFSRVSLGSPLRAVAEPLLPSLRRVLADRPFRHLLLIFVANGIASALPATLFLFFVADVLHLDSASGPLLALYFVSGAASLPLWIKVASRYGRVFAWGCAMLLSIVAFAGASLLGSGDLLPFAIICLASGLALGADLTLPAAIAADIGERQRQAGACFGVWNFVAKLNLALAAGLSLPLLGLLGYVPGSSSGLPALIFAYALLPLAFKALAGLLLWRWRHTLEL
ncbi:MAG: MFS transporter [Dechloromonas sp.]|uniref:MFS transporter n=1 Tax=Candidatus Dechloromonas phosphorivorans TaxID=2899244 RepID=A0A935K051_9RHOO|nr:MFS transporter [Candidatus Dechloromonas phosphorivorans]